MQLYNRESDLLDAATSAQAKLPENLSVGDNLPDVKASLKRHEDFSANLMTQEGMVGALLEVAHRLVDAGHYSSVTIQNRSDKVVQAREKLKANNAKKRGELDESKLFHKFRTEVGELKIFVAENRKLVREDSFRDGTGNIKAKANKHEVLEGENDGQLKVLNRTGPQMEQRNHLKVKKIGEELV